jgi:para-nitrobenzyl esterase
MSAKMNRRSFVSGAALGASTILGGAFNRAIGAGAKSGSAQGPVANTTSGKIRGVVQENKVNAFRGIPYGAPTGGANRFMPPMKPESWTGIRETIEWGPEAPQGPHTEIPEVAATIPKQTISEDCLHLNVWTNGFDPRSKRPVMVWLHGGGFTSGNGSYTMYDGANMARKHDVVNVTVNHRLNSFGFLYLADLGGEKYAQASNCGILDVVAALEWVRDNIANFGGDPNNVTIFGQSGGAGKVSTLLAMPSAKGLFHRAIIDEQSGGQNRRRAAIGPDAAIDHGHA